MKRRFGQSFWAFILKAIMGSFFVLVAFMPDRSEGWFKTSLLAMVIALAFFAWIVIPAVKASKKQSQEKLLYRSASYKDFPVSDLKFKYINPYSYESEDYSLTKRQIISDGLEDEKLYENDYRTIVPTLSDNGNGYDVLVDGNYVGKLDPETADAIDIFLADHPDHELLLSVIGGYYKLYDSVEEEMVEEYEEYSAKVCVKYYVAKGK